MKTYQAKLFVLFIIFATITFIYILQIYLEMSIIDIHHQGYVSIEGLKILGYYDDWGTYTGYGYSNSSLHPFYVNSWNYIYRGSMFISAIIGIILLIIYSKVFIKKVLNIELKTIITLLICLLFYIYIPIISCYFFYYDKSQITYKIMVYSLVGLIGFIATLVVLIINYLNNKNESKYK